MVTWLHAPGWNIIVAGTRNGDFFTFGGQEAKRGSYRKGPGQGHVPSDYFLQLGPTSYFLPPPQNNIML
jgi:hypothetical protein